LTIQAKQNKTKQIEKKIGMVYIRKKIIRNKDRIK